MLNLIKRSVGLIGNCFKASTNESGTSNMIALDASFATVTSLGSS